MALVHDLKATQLLMPGKELIDTPLALTADHQRRAVDSAATSMHASRLLSKASELLTAVNSPNFSKKVHKTQLHSARGRGKLLLGMNWFLSQMTSIEGAKDPQMVYDICTDIESKFKAKGFGRQVCISLSWVDVLMLAAHLQLPSRIWPAREIL
jgi:hypothetical protein